MSRESVFADRDKMEEAINATDSIKDAMSYLGRKPAGGNYLHFHKWAEKHGLEVKRGLNAKPGAHRRSRDDGEVFRKDSKVDRGFVRRRVLVDDLVDYICQRCGNSGTWNGGDLSLHLDHINGVRDDHRLENLRFLCPNCHSQTKTYGGRNNRDRGRANSPTTDGRARLRPESRIVERPPYEQLMVELEESNYCAVGRKYGVSDNAVRKWVKNYEKYA